MEAGTPFEAIGGRINLHFPRFGSTKVITGRTDKRRLTKVPGQDTIRRKES